MGSRQYECQFGCSDVAFGCRRAIAEHLISKHSKRDLKKWGLNKHVLRLYVKALYDQDNL